ncbi:MAG: DNA-binding protein [Faecalimonas umbilicata]|uniref:DNA-binding protein n=1 Tax=Faecalimonas umbilicata TaxID=1912855 RepID=UPI0039934CFD
MASKLFISAKEVAKELEVSDSYAYRLIRQLNAELEQKSFVVVKGKISRKYFEERVYGMNEMK